MRGFMDSPYCSRADMIMIRGRNLEFSMGWANQELTLGIIKS
jgi:hypothetical protein